MVKKIRKRKPGCDGKHSENTYPPSVRKGGVNVKTKGKNVATQQQHALYQINGVPR